MTTLPDMEPAALAKIISIIARTMAVAAGKNADQAEAEYSTWAKMAVNTFRPYLAARSVPEAGKAVTDAMVKRATQEFLSHRGERPERIKRGGYELWEENAPAMRAALTAALASSPSPTGAEPAPTGEIAEGTSPELLRRLYRDALAEINNLNGEAADLRRKLEEAERRIAKLEADLAFADEQSAKVEALLEPHIKWDEPPAHEPGTIRICPMRDGPCRHGLNCPYAGDGYAGYPCKEGWNGPRTLSGASE